MGVLSVVKTSDELSRGTPTSSNDRASYMNETEADLINNLFDNLLPLRDPRKLLKEKVKE